MCVVVEISVGPGCRQAWGPSTSFGWRLTSLRKTGISWLTRFLLAHWRDVYGEVLATLRVDARSAFGADPGSLAASLRKSSAM
jgi:hypothetical protein